MMKKITLSALAAVAVAGTAFAGPSTVITSKEYKQPCVTPCFRDQEFQLDLFYSYNDASHQGDSVGSDRFTFGPTTTPIASGLLPNLNPLLTGPTVIPDGSVVSGSGKVTAKIPQYFRDGSGGGVGLNYFFYRYVGIGIEGNWWDGTTSGFNASSGSRDTIILSAPVDAAVLAAAAANVGATIVSNDGTTVVVKRKVNFGSTHRSAANQVTGSLILRYPFEGPICWAPYIFGGGGGVFDGESTGFGHVGVGVEFRVTPYMGFFTDWRWEFMGGNGDDNGIRDSRAFRELQTAVNNGTLNTTLITTGNLRNLNGHSNNDVNMTRVGVRFVF